MSNFREERKLWQKGYKRVVGLDESGRGPLAGPVVAAAVSIDPNYLSYLKSLKGIRDSKKLSLKKREEFYKILTNSPAGRLALEWGRGRVSAKVIDKINILEATKLAMKRAVKNLEKKYLARFGAIPRQKIEGSQKLDWWKADFLIIDGNFKINLPIPQKSIVKADQKVFSCIAASILAKVWRDRIMKRYADKYPKYNFAQHKGYPTKLHFEILKKYGPCKIHRKSFRLMKAVQATEDN